MAALVDYEGTDATTLALLTDRFLAHVLEPSVLKPFGTDIVCDRVLRAPQRQLDKKQYWHC